MFLKNVKHLIATNTSIQQFLQTASNAYLKLIKAQKLSFFWFCCCCCFVFDDDDDDDDDDDAS